MKRRTFSTPTRTRFAFIIYYRSPRTQKWKKKKELVYANGKRQAAFKASKYLTGKWIKPVLR